MNKKIILGSDHAGFELKEEVKNFLIKLGFKVEDKGAHNLNSQDDYPKFILSAAKCVAEDLKNNLGIIFGGSGQGEAIVANKVPGVRAAVYYGSKMDIVKLSRTHNDANILSLGARFLNKKEALEAVKLWLNTDFSKEERHQRRIEQIHEIEEKTCK